MEKLMVPDERDRKFDKALSRHLRSLAPSGEAAKSRVDAAFESTSCADLETLAAYHERSLLAQEMNSFKEHIVGCAHCQSILAQLESTNAIPLQAEMQEETPALQEAMPMAAAEKSSPAAQPRMLIKTRSSRLYLGPRWKWLAPAGALAAGLLVWVALHENQQLVLHNTNEVKLATKQAPVSPSPSAPTGVIQGTPVPLSKHAITKPQSAVDEFASANTRAEPGAADLRQRKLDYQARVSPSRTLADKERETRKDTTRDATADSLAAAIQTDLDAKAVPPTAQEKVEVQAEEQAANAQIQNQNQYVYNAPKTPGPAPLGQANSLKKTKAAPPAPTPPAAAGGVAGFTSATAMESAVISNSHLISPPGSSVIWRAGRAGLIEFSPDKGASWSRQTSGVLADLLTGSAPSDKVCWIVGRAGTVLLTIDGGEHWKLISSPLKEDLGGVQATDALHATIWDAIRKWKSFETSDGGLTWKLLPNQ
jgi:hypothetical protein